MDLQRRIRRNGRNKGRKKKKNPASRRKLRIGTTKKDIGHEQ